ncbi:MAG TPA: APC family permease [Syntrophomonadaceae bacterium]|nr:APC family permease [Syntrophomonadaceae bacterium]
MNSDKQTIVSLEQFGYKQELKRSLTVTDLIIYGLIFMVPIAPFGIYGFVADGSKGMVALAYLIGMVGMIFTAYSYARMSEAFPMAGSVYTYAARGINETVGFFAGWAILMDYILVPALLYVVAGAALNAIVHSIPVFVWALFFILINTVVNVRGIELTAGFNKIMLILELIVFLIFVIIGVIAISHGVNGAHFTFKPFYDPANFSMSMVMGAVSIAVLSFLGFDGISTLSEETKGGNKVVGKATVAALLIVGALFITQTYVAACLWPDFKSFKDLNTAFYDVAKIAGGTWLMWTCIIATAVAWGIANSLAAQSAVSRVLYSMARDRYMPAFLAKVHPKYQSPYMATIFIAIISIIITAIFSSKIAALTSLVNFGALTSFLILNVSVIVYYLGRKKSKDYVRHLLMPILGFVVIFYVWISLDIASKTLGAWWLGIGVVYFLFLTYVLKRKPTNMEV